MSISIRIVKGREIQVLNDEQVLAQINRIEFFKQDMSGDFFGQKLEIIPKGLFRRKYHVFLDGVELFYLQSSFNWSFHAHHPQTDETLWSVEHKGFFRAKYYLTEKDVELAVISGTNSWTKVVFETDLHSADNQLQLKLLCCGFILNVLRQAAAAGA